MCSGAVHHRSPLANHLAWTMWSDWYCDQALLRFWCLVCRATVWRTCMCRMYWFWRGHMHVRCVLGPAPLWCPLWPPGLQLLTATIIVDCTSSVLLQHSLLQAWLQAENTASTPFSLDALRSEQGARRSSARSGRAPSSRASHGRGCAAWSCACFYTSVAERTIYAWSVCGSSSRVFSS